MLQNNFNYFLLTYDSSCFSLLCADKRRGNWIWVYEILVFKKTLHITHLYGDVNTLFFNALRLDLSL